MAATGGGEPGHAGDLGTGATAGGGWRIYLGTGEPHDGIDRLPPPPRWRSFDGPLPHPAKRSGTGAASGGVTAARHLGAIDRARPYRPDDDVVELVNVALYLRRPLLVTGKPGVGKSTLARHVAYELKLGPVLYWPITSRSNIQDALYRYDAIGRLQEANLYRQAASGPTPPPLPDIGRYIRLGPLGTALVPQDRPRVLLIDELDKSDIDLPNDLLNVFEEGWFDIPELARLPEGLDDVEVTTADGDERVVVHRGHVRCRAFPFVVITSNAEREFPPPFLRRCVRLEIRPPSREQLAGIVAAHLGEEILAESAELIDRFLAKREHGDLATDQLLNAIYLVTSGSRPPGEDRGRLVDAVLRQLDRTGPR